jgi:nucleoside permease NupC
MELKLLAGLGLIVFLGCAWAISSHRKKFPWRTVLWGLGLQFTFALLILKTRPGRAVFDYTGAAIRKLADFANEGSKFVFGPLANNEVMTEAFGPQNALVLGILIMSTIIIVAMLSSVLYHWGVLQKIVHAIAWVMRKAMRTSGAETLSAAANVFMGQTEAPSAGQTLHPAHDPERIALHDDGRDGDDCGRRGRSLCDVWRASWTSRSRRTFVDRFRAECSRRIARRQNYDAGNGSQ